MFSLRTAARSGARVVPRLAGMSTRSGLSAAVVRPALKAGTTVFLTKPQLATYSSESSGVPVSQGIPEVGPDLCDKLQREIEHEADFNDDDAPASIKDLIAAGEWQITDVVGKEHVVLVRQFRDEKITVTFSIVDIANFEDGENENFEDAEADSEEPSEEEGESHATPCRLHIVIEKPGKTAGALNIETTASFNEITVESAFYYPDAKMAHTASANDEFAAQEMYPGPPFDQIDPEVQSLMDRYIEERGINQNLAVFASDYMTWKEQKEYVGWLKNVKKFVEA